jgi:hypothetical protein
MKHILTFEDFLNEANESFLNEANETPQSIADFLTKNQKHFAAFLKPKSMTATVDGDTVTIEPSSKSFVITVDFKKMTIDGSGKPARPESTSYVEIIEFLKGRTKFNVIKEEKEI